MPGIQLPVQATPDYSDGDSIGTKLTLSTGGIRANHGYISRFQLRSKIAIGVQLFVHFFDSDPAASTFTDNAALVIHANDHSKLIKTLALPAADWVAPKGASPWYTAELIDPAIAKSVIAFGADTARNCWFALEADGTINFAATTDMMAYYAIEGA